MLSLAPHVTVTETGDGVVLLDERSGRYWQMNGTGAVVLDRLLAGADPVAELAAQHPDERDRIAQDVRALLSALRAANLVTTS